MSGRRRSLGAPKPAPNAIAIIIGNELLSGKIADQNLEVLARTLRPLGVSLSYALTITDDLATIAREVRRASKNARWVFTSGGVGPTHDDLTLLGVARAFGKQLRTSPQLDALIRRVYGAEVLPGHLEMARIPEGACLEQTPEVPWPAVRMRNVWILPGVPQIFAVKMQIVRSVIGQEAAPFASVSVLLGLDEGQLKPALDNVVAAHPDVQVGSYPRWGDNRAKTRITFDARDEAICQAARAALIHQLAAGSVVDEDPVA